MTSDYSENNLKIAKLLYEKMKTLPIGTEISVTGLGKLVLEEHEQENEFTVSYDDWWDVYDALEDVVKNDKKLKMDYTKWRGVCAGLPFNLEFMILKHGQCMYSKELKAAKKFAVENGLYGVRFLRYWYENWVFDIINKPGIVVDQAYPPTYIIVENNLKVHFCTEEEAKYIYECSIELLK